MSASLSKTTWLAGAAAMTGTALSLGHTLKSHAATLKSNRKSAIMLWMGGGPPSIDIWDMKPGTETGGPFQPIETSREGVYVCGVFQEPKDIPSSVTEASAAACAAGASSQMSSQMLRPTGTPSISTTQASLPATK